MNDFEMWRRVTQFNRGENQEKNIRRLYVPAIEPVGELPYELAGLLPNREHKKDLMTLIEKLPENRSGDRSVVGVFAADPFLNCKQVADRLIAKGYHHVANIPPVASYSIDFLSTLDKVAAGKAQEHKTINQFIERGLSICPAVATVECLDDVRAWRPRRLWVAPNFNIWQQGTMRSEKLLELCRAVARKTEFPVVLIPSGTDISATDAYNAGARGILLETT